MGIVICKKSYLSDLEQSLLEEKKLNRKLNQQLEDTVEAMNLLNYEKNMLLTRDRFDDFKELYD